MTAPRPARNPFWMLLVAAAAGFCISTLAYVAAGFGDRAHPLNQFFNRHGAVTTTGFAVATMLLAGLALTVDRRQTLRQSPAPMARHDRAPAPQDGLPAPPP